MTLNTAYIRLCLCGRIPTLKREKDSFWIECACGNHSEPIERIFFDKGRCESDWQVMEKVITLWNEEAADVNHN